MAFLTVIRGADRGRRFEVFGPVLTLGRDAKSNIRLHDSETSRHHAELRRTKDGYVLYDLDSSNGSYLNGKRVEHSLIRTGDCLRIGQSEMIFTADPVAQPSTAQLAGRIDMVTRQKESDASAIVRAIKQSEGSEYLRHPERAGSQWLHDALANLAVMYETSQAVSRITDVSQLLDHIMDLIFSSIRADRGCIMLKDVETAQLMPTAVRYSGDADRDERIAISRTIMDFVLDKDEGVLVLDAAQDQRFSSAQSVVQLGIREAICVPLRGRHDTVGVIYVDTKSDRKQFLETQRPAKFSEDHLKLMIAIAHQAGIAIEDSRFYQAMMQAERLAAIGQTIATLSHHIKNILQGLRSGSYLIEMGLNDEKADVLRQGWNIVQKNQQKIYNLVMDMLSFSKEREPVLEMTSVNHLVQDVIELMAPRATELGVKLTAELEPQLTDVAIDAEGIHRAVLNIVTNALDAVEGKMDGAVVVKTALDPGGRYFQIGVVDNGVGIAPEQMSKIFQIFASTKGSRGSGLGLAVSQKIAQEHGGEIRVTSKVGQGSQFVIELPLRRTKPGDSDPGQHLTITHLQTPTHS